MLISLYIIHKLSRDHRAMRRALHVWEKSDFASLTSIFINPLLQRNKMALELMRDQREKTRQSPCCSVPCQQGAPRAGVGILLFLNVSGFGLGIWGLCFFLVITHSVKNPELSKHKKYGLITRMFRLSLIWAYKTPSCLFWFHLKEPGS